MKKILIILLVLASFGANAQVKISDMPTFIGDPSGGWVPIVISGVNRKVDAAYLGYDKLNDVYLKIGTDSLFKNTNGLATFIATTLNSDSLALKANDNAVVHLAGTETITGIKTFTNQIISSGYTVTSGAGIPGNQSVLITDTVDASNDNVAGALFNWKTRGSSTNNANGLMVRLDTGYTGSGLVRVADFQNYVAGSQTLNLMDTKGVLGAGIESQGYSTGDNIGTYSVAGRATGRNISGYFRALDDSGSTSSKVNVGVLGYAGHYGTTTIGSKNAIGGYFGIYYPGSNDLKPVLDTTNSALVADNGGATASIFLGRVNNTTKVTIDSIGQTGIGMKPTAPLSIYGDMSSSKANVFNLNSTMDGASSLERTVSITSTLSGTGSGVRDGFFTYLNNSGYTGSGRTDVAVFNNNAGSSSAFNPLSFAGGNNGVAAFSQGTTTSGDNVGTYSYATNSSHINLGGLFRASSTVGSNVGVWGLAYNNPSSQGRIAGLFQLDAASSKDGTDSTLQSVILSDNGTSRKPMFIGKTLDSVKFQLDNIGRPILVPQPLYATPINGRIEYDGTHYYGTIGSTRYQLDQQGGWGLTGNTGITSGTQFIGTTDSAKVRIKTKGLDAIVIDSLQHIGIGSDPQSYAQLRILGASGVSYGIDVTSATSSGSVFRDPSGYLQLTTQKIYSSNNLDINNAVSKVITISPANTLQATFDATGIHSVNKIKYTTNPTMTAADSLVATDKKYVDSVHAISILTASNGLTKTGNDVELGGTLTGNNNLLTGAYSLDIASTSGTPITIETSANTESLLIRNTSSNTGTVYPLLIQATTPQSTANGVGIEFDATGGSFNRQIGYISTHWTDTTNANRQAVMFLAPNYKDSYTYGLNIFGNGKMQANGYGQGLFQSTPAYDLSVTSTGNIVERRDTIPLLSFGFGSGLAADTAAASTSAIYGSLYNQGTDTLNITRMKIGLQGTSPNVTVTIYYNDSLGVTAGATKLVNAGSAATDVYTGTTVTSFDNAKIPPGNWIWCQTTSITTKPTYLSVTLIGTKNHN